MPVFIARFNCSKMIILEYHQATGISRTFHYMHCIHVFQLSLPFLFTLSIFLSLSYTHTYRGCLSYKFHPYHFQLCIAMRLELGQGLGWRCDNSTHWPLWNENDRCLYYLKPYYYLSLLSCVVASNFYPTCRNNCLCRYKQAKPSLRTYTISVLNRIHKLLTTQMVLR